MRIDFDLAQLIADRLAPPRPDPGAWPGLQAALAALSGGRGELVRHAERRWASITFAGSRHSVVLAFSGSDAVAAGERFIAALPDHEFAIPGQLIADAAVTAVEHTMLPRPRIEVEAEFLLVEEA